MTHQRTRWFEYGEPTDNDRVEAEIRTTYQGGPSDPSREDDVITGTVGIEVLEMMDEDDEIRHHTHEDGSVMLSGLSPDTESAFLETFEEGDD